MKYATSLVLALSALLSTSAFALPGAAMSASASGSYSYQVGTRSGSASETDTGNPATVALTQKYGFAANADAASLPGGTLSGKSSTALPTGVVSGYYSNTAAASTTSTYIDYFMITGGTGVVSATMATSLSGVMKTGGTGNAGYSFSVIYAPVSNTYCYWYLSNCTAADYTQTVISDTGSIGNSYYGGATNLRKKAISESFESDFTFEYNKAFSLTTTLNTNAANGGSADFSSLQSVFGLYLPTNATLVSASGMSYVPSVPEPETYATLAVGLGIMAFVARRRVRS